MSDEMKRVDCEGVGDNDGFFEMATSDETPNPCDCHPQNDTSELEMQILWKGRKTDIAVIYCTKCGEVEPVKYIPSFFDNTEFSQMMYKKWNAKESLK